MGSWPQIDAVAGDRAESGGGGGHGLGSGGGLGAGGCVCRMNRRCGAIICCRVRGDLLKKLGRMDEARAEFERAASITRNVRERNLLLERARSCGE